MVSFLNLLHLLPTIIKDKGANHPFAASGWITKDADQRGQVERHTTNHTQPTIYTAYLKHILWLKVCERTVLKETVCRNCIDCWYRNVYQRQEGCRRAEDGKILIFTSPWRPQPSPLWKVLLKIDFKTVNTVLSQTFNHKICFEYAIRRRCQLSVVSF